MAGAVVRLFVGIYGVTWPINTSWLLLSTIGALPRPVCLSGDTDAGGLVDGLMYDVLMAKLQNRLAGYQNRSIRGEGRDVKHLGYAWEARK